MNMMPIKQALPGSNQSFCNNQSSQTTLQFTWTNSVVLLLCSVDDSLGIRPWLCMLTIPWTVSLHSVYLSCSREILVGSGWLRILIVSNHFYLKLYGWIQFGRRVMAPRHSQLCLHGQVQHIPLNLSDRCMRLEPPRWGDGTVSLPEINRSLRKP